MILDVNEALEKLAVQNKMQADLVKLRYFAGMTLEEAAETMGISARTARPLLGARPGVALPRNQGRSKSEQGCLM